MEASRGGVLAVVGEVTKTWSDIGGRIVRAVMRMCVEGIRSNIGSDTREEAARPEESISETSASNLSKWKSAMTK